VNEDVTFTLVVPKLPALTREELERGKRLLDVATEGPWLRWRAGEIYNGSAAERVPFVTPFSHSVATFDAYSAEGAPNRDRQNADLVCWLRNHADALLICAATVIVGGKGGRS